jgi:branched-subunit amino acid ABC-type transport system permease component
MSIPMRLWPENSIPQVLLLVLSSWVLYTASGLAVRLRLSLFKGFDFSIPAAIAIASESFVVISAQMHYLGRFAIWVSLLGAVSCSGLFMLGWNHFLLRLICRNDPDPGKVFVSSLGILFSVTGMLGLTRGAGLRQGVIGADFWSFPGGIVVGESTFFALGLGAVVLVGFWIWTKSPGGVQINLLAQNGSFCEEIGISMHQVSLSAALTQAILLGFVGSYVAFASGSEPQVGFGFFLYGAGAALAFRRSTWSATAAGAGLLASVTVLSQLILAPAWSEALTFTGVIGVVARWGPSPWLEAVRLDSKPQTCF